MTQLPPLPFIDYKMIGAVDSVKNENETEIYHINDNIVIQGWDFECRSGLMPFMQRQGSFNIYFTRVVSPPFGEVFIPPVAFIIIRERQDVLNALSYQCPAMGKNVGYRFLAAVPNEPGTWHMTFSIMTSDGAGRPLEFKIERDIIVQ